MTPSPVETLLIRMPAIDGSSVGMGGNHRIVQFQHAVAQQPCRLDLNRVTNHTVVLRPTAHEAPALCNK